MTTSGLALLLACGAFAVQELIRFKSIARESLTTVAKIVSENCTAALALEDRKTAAEILAASGADSHIQLACIFDKSGSVVAQYTRPDQRGKLQPPAPAEEGFKDEARHMGLFMRVTLEGEVIGLTYFRYDLGEHYAHLAQRAVIWVLVIAASCLAAFLLASRLQRLISDAILKLARIERRISSEKNFSLRVEKSSNDEVGLLIDGFNDMLSEIQKRDRQLEEHRWQLEEQVACRTTELVALNAQLLGEKERAEAATKAKSEFLADMSHEIRTPMNGILGMTELVLETALDPDQRTHLEMVKSSADALLTVINDILDFSKIEAGKMALAPVELRLRDSLSDAMRLLALRAEKKGLELTCRVSPHVPDSLVGDPDRLRQILLNLVENAIKFTDEGEVAGSAVPVILTVPTSGPPADAVLLKGAGGSGCVTKPVKQSDLLEALQAALALQPETSPPTTRLSPDRCVKAKGWKPLHVLLAEDNAVNLKLASRLLEKRGHSVTVASNGKEALEALAKGSFDAVLMDLQMPEMGGIEATSVIRSDEKRTERHVPIIAMTANAMSGDRERCLEAGMDGYISKPIQRDVLFETLESLALGLKR